jgi:adenosine deaminase
MSDLAAVIAAFAATQSVLLAPEALERIAFEAVEDAWFDGIRLLELRYAPSFATKGHQLTFDDAFDAFEKGIRRAQAKYPMGVGIILILVREHGDEAAEATMEHALKKRNSILGLDLAGIEKDHSPSLFRKYFDQAHSAGLGLTAHAGEEPGHSANIAQAVDELNVTRIGHGVQIKDSREIFDMVKTRGIVLELCPTSNWLTGAVQKIEEHPIRDYFHAGIPVTINSDDPGVFNIRLSGEFRLCSEKLGFTRPELLKTIRTALNASFFDPDKKQFYEKKYFPPAEKN